VTDRFLRQHDVLLTATAPEPAAVMTVFTRDWPPPSRAVAVYTAPFNVTGHPAVSVPSGLAPNGLPLGVQIAGRAFDEATVLRVARAVERDVTIGVPGPPRP
jgi:aspartyl-tRNA(Asn)/glutamyl-tRNA(Gln) amidotransferase subunit A